MRSLRGHLMDSVESIKDQTIACWLLSGRAGGVEVTFADGQYHYHDKETGKRHRYLTITHLHLRQHDRALAEKVHHRLLLYPTTAIIGSLATTTSITASQPPSPPP